MRTVGHGLLCLFGGGLLVGCQDAETRGMARLGPAGEIVRASMNNLGWSRSDAQLESARFTAVVTTYDEQGKSYTDRQEMVFDFADDRITAVGGTPQGRWRAAARGDGEFTLAADRDVNEGQVEARMAPTLVALLHRLRGPYNLLDRKEHARSADATRVVGQDVVRVGVDGDNRQAVAYYFDAASGILKFVTAGADRAGRKGTITEYRYDSHPNGMLFPSHVRLAHLGDHVLVGEKPIFEVEISDVEF